MTDFENPPTMDQDSSASSGANPEEDHASSSSESGNSSHPRTIEEQKEIAAAETKAVFRLKLFVLAVLVASAISVSLVVYHYMTRAETVSFEGSFDDDSDKVFESIGSSLDRTLEAIDSFVVATASYAEATNSTWPFVTMPNFAVRIAKIRSLSKATYIGQYQYVTEEQRRLWQNYSIEHAGWVEQSITIQKEDSTYRGKIIDQYNLSDTIYGNYGDIPYGQGSYLPTWQAAPVIPRYPPFNWDGYQYPPLVSALPELFEKRRVVIGAVSNLPDPNNPGSAAAVAAQNDWLKDFLAPGDIVTEPTSDINYPVFNTAADHVEIRSDPNAKPVGIFSVTFFWRDLLTGLLPLGANGVIAVFENGCNQTFTYQIDGPQAVYLGPEDKHDPTFDFLEKQSHFQDLRASALKQSENVYTGLELTNVSCPYTLRLYPSATFRSSYYSKNPVIFAVASTFIFLFTSAVFLLYDCLVERRQRKVMRTGKHLL